MIKVLVTGATGFVGRTTVRVMLERGYDVAVAVRDRQKAALLFGDAPVTVIDTAGSGFADEVRAYAPDAAVHLAACFDADPDEAGRERLVDTNLMLTIRLLEALRGTGCGLVVSTGTFSEFYRDRDGSLVPQNLYSATKSAQRPIMSYYRSAEGWKWVDMVVYTPYGRVNPTRKVIDYMVQALDSEEPVGFSAGEQVLDFVHVDDIAELLCRIIERVDRLAPEENLEAGTGQGYSLLQVAEAMERVFGGRLNAVWGARPYRQREIMHAVADVTRVRQLLDWQPSMSLERGLAIFRDDLRAHKP